METEVKKFGAEVKRLTARERAALSDFLVYLNSLAESMVSPRSMLAVACYAISCLNNTHMAVLVTRHLGQLHGSSSMFVIRDIFALRISAAVKPFRRLHTLPLLFLKCYVDPEVGALRIDNAVSLRGVPLTLLAAEKEDAKAVLMLFLKEQRLNKTAASRAINKSDLFIDHLVSQLHSIHKSRYLVGLPSVNYHVCINMLWHFNDSMREIHDWKYLFAGRELTTLEIRDALIPYLENLQLEHGSNLVDVVENFPNMPINENLTAEAISPNVILESKKLPDETCESRKLKAIARVSKLPQHVIYLIELGMDLEDIQQITRKFPAFAYYSLDGKVRPVVEFLLELGIPKFELAIILRKTPQLCGLSLSENLIPTMNFLEGLGLDKEKWAKVMYRFPSLLKYSRQKLMSTVDFLYEMGLTAQDVGKILTHWPNIISYSVEENLRPTAKYFSLLGIDVAVVLVRSPQTFGLSIERNLKPITVFFLEKGYSLEDLRTMIKRVGTLYTYSLVKNVIPKWNFFLTMGYPQSDLVKFPHFFGYSLEKRIKPRFALVRQYGVKLILNKVLSLSSNELEKVLERKLKRNGGKVLME